MVGDEVFDDSAVRVLRTIAERQSSRFCASSRMDEPFGVAQAVAFGFILGSAARAAKVAGVDEVVLTMHFRSSTCFATSRSCSVKLSRGLHLGIRALGDNLRLFHVRLHLLHELVRRDLALRELAYPRRKGGLVDGQLVNGDAQSAE